MAAKGMWRCPICELTVQDTNLTAPDYFVAHNFFKHTVLTDQEVESFRPAYHRHVELKTCETHGRGYFYCVHPAADSKYEDLLQVCLKCREELVQGPGT